MIKLLIAEVKSFKGEFFFIILPEKVSGYKYNLSSCLFIKFFRFVEVTRRLLVSEGEDARLECGVESFPRGPDTIRWTRDGYDIGECRLTVFQNYHF